MLEDMCRWKHSPCIFWPRRDVMTGGHLYCWFPVSDQLYHTGTAWLEVTHSFRFSGSSGEFFRGRMAVIAGTESLEAPLDHPREQGEDRTNLIINYLPQVSSWRFQHNTLTLNLPFLQAMTDNELYSMFITVGQIVSAKIMRDKSSGYSYGYGFVHYQQPEDAAKAIASLNGLQVFLAQRFHIMFMILTTGFQQKNQSLLQSTQHGRYQGHKSLRWERSTGALQNILAFKSKCNCSCFIGCEWGGAWSFVLSTWKLAHKEAAEGPGGQEQGHRICKVGGILRKVIARWMKCPHT